LLILAKVNLGRAARTDAGVHAAGNVVSIKMIVSVPGVDDIASRINDELPPEIRVWGYVGAFILYPPHHRHDFYRSGCKTRSMQGCLLLCFL
jgi:tRNA pseudouridine(38-40) synthase